MYCLWERRIVKKEKLSKSNFLIWIFLLWKRDLIFHFKLKYNFLKNAFHFPARNFFQAEICKVCYGILDIMLNMELNTYLLWDRKWHVYIVHAYGMCTLCLCNRYINLQPFNFLILKDHYRVSLMAWSVNEKSFPLYSGFLLLHFVFYLVVSVAQCFSVFFLVFWIPSESPCNCKVSLLFYPPPRAFQNEYGKSKA